jgi:hypothetical protein
MEIPPFGLKESVEVIESRIPGGRFLTTVLLCLLLLSVATACGAYLYRN